jgi:hypothetical protein
VALGRLTPPLRSHSCEECTKIWREKNTIQCAKGKVKRDFEPFFSLFGAIWTPNSDCSIIFVFACEEVVSWGLIPPSTERTLQLGDSPTRGSFSGDHLGLLKNTGKLYQLSVKVLQVLKLLAGSGTYGYQTPHYQISKDLLTHWTRSQESDISWIQLSCGLINCRKLFFSYHKKRPQIPEDLIPKCIRPLGICRDP